MEPWSARDDRPYLREERKSWPWVVGALAIVLLGGLVYYFASYVPARQPEPAPVAAAPAPPASAPRAGAQPAVVHPLQPPAEVPKSLPALDVSDSMMRESIAKLIGRKAFEDFVYPAQLVRRIVATVDNLPRRTAPRRVMPLNPVPRAFVTARAGDASVIDSANSLRYVPYVRALEAVRARALVEIYVQAYPLFQQAYEQLGYPGKYFNDRLIEAIDDLLQAPEIEAPPRLVQPKVLYEFADPDFETRSAGQKILIRMGRENALKVKAKLREVRQELAAALARKP
jgi:hypothetical protein